MGGAPDVDALLAAAWSEHAERPREVADRLAASLDAVRSPEHVAAFARLATHVLGEHLGEWERGVSMLEALRALPACEDSGAAAGAIARGIATLRFAAGDADAPSALSPDDRIAAIAAASSAFAGRGEVKRALDAYAQALALAEAGIADGSPALRALAVGGNNLAAALEERRDRDDAETRGMVAAARSALAYWTLAGTWLEEERAHYRLARSLVCADEPLAAIESAARCVDVCKRNNAPPFERFFAHAALAIAQRAAGDRAAFEASRRHAFAQYERIPADERPWCEADLKAMAAT
ncbi:hypothetical protein BURK1_01195 [Burkholderiales bacterium]|nr:hypothetical protein BURK1_01195 [Burkholderiales bacterium]